jgi:ABC-type glycerol-3-phosphate transport system permease component
VSLQGSKLARFVPWIGSSARVSWMGTASKSFSGTFVAYTLRLKRTDRRKNRLVRAMLSI